MSADGKEETESEPKDAQEAAMTDFEQGLSSDTCNCATQLYEAMNVSLRVSKFDKTDGEQFLPQDAFERIWSAIEADEDSGTQHMLKLMDIQPYESSEDDRRLAKYILKDAKKIFLIAIWMNLRQLQAAMELFRVAQFCDEDLPIEEWSGQRFKSTSETHKFVQMEESQSASSRRIWDMRSITDFQSDQWPFLAPKISTKIQTCNFDNKCPIPFVAKSTKQCSGAHGIVNRYTIHHAHFENVLRPVNSPLCHLNAVQAN